MSKIYSGAEIVFKCLEDQGVEFIFGYPGGAVLPIYDELKNHYMTGSKIQNQLTKKKIFIKYISTFQEATFLKE